MTNRRPSAESDLDGALSREDFELFEQDPFLDELRGAFQDTRAQDPGDHFFEALSDSILQDVERAAAARETTSAAPPRPVTSWGVRLRSLFTGPVGWGVFVAAAAAILMVFWLGGGAEERAPGSATTTETPEVADVTIEERLEAATGGELADFSEDQFAQLDDLLAHSAAFDEPVEGSDDVFEDMTPGSALDELDDTTLAALDAELLAAFPVEERRPR